MALIYQAQLTPSKLAVLQAWVPSQSWLGDLDISGLATVGAYRFDDPAGEVGIETHLLSTEAGALLQVPLTYRPSPLVGLPALATMKHSVLGQRWVYDGCLDPVYTGALLTTILTGGEQAELLRAGDGGPTHWEVTTFVRGSGSPGTVVPDLHFGPAETRGSTTVLTAGPVELTLLRVLDTGAVSAGVPGLTGRWPGQDEPALLALIRGI